MTYSAERIERWRSSRWGDAAAATARVWAKVDRRGPDECWPWTGHRTPNGYGWHGNVTAHRIVLGLTLGRPVAKGMDACHTCDNRVCCNPAHLYEGTRKQNMQDAKERGRMYSFPVRRGEAHPLARLTQAEVDEIRALRPRAQSHDSFDIADRFGISYGNVRAILTGKAWEP